MLKKILGAIICLSMMVPTSTSIANATNLKDNDSLKTITSENTDYWRERFESFDNYLEQNPENELVGEDEVYIKYTLKDGINPNSKMLTELDYNKELCTKEQYELENSKRVTIGPSSPVNPEPRWIRLDLQVYKTSKSNTFMAHSFWEWKTKPVFLFTDLNGIYVSSGMIIGSNTSSTPMISEYVQSRPNGYPSHKLNPIKISPNSNGMMGVIDINGGSEILPVDGHMGMTQTPIVRNNTSYKKIQVYTSYVHKQLAIGSPSFDTSGKPSFGLNVSTDEHAARVSLSF